MAYGLGAAELLRQQGHSPSNHFASDVKAIGCGSIMIALNAIGAVFTIDLQHLYC